MDLLSPIFTEKRQCQDCYKCVRHCPVKTIKIEGGCATVIAEQCIFCGTCVLVCPSGAKRVRDDLPRAQRLVAEGPNVIVSLAPSYVSAFPGLAPERMIAALRQLGFARVSETALGAQQVSAHVAQMLDEQPGRVLISSACPPVVAYLQKHRQEYASMLTPLLSPMLTHARLLKQVYGEDSAVVFIGPCIAKKVEADAHPELVEVVLTFEDLQEWFRQAQIDPSDCATTDEDHFCPERATDGSIYAIDGGMIAGIRANAPVNDCALMAFSGMSSIAKAITGLEQLKLERSMMVELLACEGGCINGPRLGSSGSTIAKRYALLSGSQYCPEDVPRRPEVPIAAPFPPEPRGDALPSDAQVRQALHQVGKYSSDDELNCGGCGYDSCHEFGRALLSAKAERSQCVTYMRQLAHKKANTLIQKMPSAVVIVDQTLRVVEHNDAFCRLVAPPPAEVPPHLPESRVSMEGRLLADLVPFHRLFSAVLRSGEDLVDKDIRYGNSFLQVSIFTIEKHALVGGIVQDITRPAVQKEQVIRKAQEVIRRHLATVQQIACLLGENASESEITLNSIIESFTAASLDSEEPPASAPLAPNQPQSGTDTHDWRKHYRR
jgi:iron only hydrogenase large subunit-like protein